ncbi:hypothetical protein Cflav_PD2342 [Pedosphaera parvula Ellin514]|uniref:Uncharacterized protein n=1 Tax=Pedosphaera parvula (strain Ellin514) TaxID=320771 RepID=B9XL04_PEDPL|nr:hypothetical protein Cflav_PD2342 [Pedosphaera parvula Ellin514]
MLSQISTVTEREITDEIEMDITVKCLCGPSYTVYEEPIFVARVIRCMKSQSMAGCNFPLLVQIVEPMAHLWPMNIFERHKAGLWRVNKDEPILGGAES